jgi:protein SCO1
VPADYPGMARRLRCIATALILAAPLAGCAAATQTSNGAAAAAVIDSSPASAFDGVLLARPLAKPAITLTDTSGAAFDLASRTSGRLTLVYFGYTHCPDVCPTTMADLAAALRQLPAAERSRVTVVFITTDPARDTPPVIRAWLNQFDPAFLGLTGPFATIQHAAASVGVDVEAPVREPDGSYQVTHGAEVLAFTTDNKAHVVWTSGETVAQYDHDLPLLLSGADLHAA